MRRHIEQLLTQERIDILLPFTLHEATLPQPFVATQIPFVACMPFSKNLQISRWSCVTDVITTNDGSNYWTIALSGFTTTGVALASFTTATDTVGTWTQHNVLAAGMAVNPLTTSYKYVYITVTKTGSPGGLYVHPALLGSLYG